MMYRLIATDMDGTLLNSGKAITQSAYSVIRQVLDLGIVFIVATGRPARGVEPYLREIDVHSPLITLNGALVIEPESGQVLFKEDIDQEIALEIIEQGKGSDTTVCVWSCDQLYVNKINERVADYAQKSGGVSPLLIKDAASLVKQGVSKILWSDEVGDISKYASRMKLVLGDRATCTTSDPWYLEFYSPNALKAKALALIGERYGIEAHEMIALGDGLNDLSMLEYAGCGIAMGNAPEELKAAADHIALTNDEDGFAHAIDDLVLQSGSARPTRS